MTAGIGIIKIGSSSSFSSNNIITVGGLMLVVSTAASIAALSLTGASFQWPAPDTHNSGATLLIEYQDRNKILGKLSRIAILFGTAGSALIIVGVVNETSLKLNFGPGRIIIISGIIFSAGIIYGRYRAWKIAH